MAPSSPFNPMSAQARAISHLFTITLAWGAFILLLVLTLVVYCAIRFRDRGEPGYPKQAFGKPKLEVAWTVAPLTLLAGLFVLTVGAIHASDPPKPARQPDLQVIAHQWWWEIRYPHSGAVAANEIHIPAGQPMLTQLNSADVVHNFWVPQLGPKKDMVPGYSNLIWLRADRPGIYMGACSEYCGAGHGWMRIHVFADPPQVFEAWLAHQLARAPAPAPNVEQGARLFARSTCVNCHAIAGTKGKADVGPDLTHFASRTTIATGVLQNTRRNVYQWLQDPQQYKPGAYMPNFHFDQTQLEAMTAYLETMQ